jgi:hypothetical protein
VTKLDDKGASHPHTRKNDGTATGVGLSKIKMRKGLVQVSVNVGAAPGRVKRRPGRPSQQSRVRRAGRRARKQ